MDYDSRINLLLESPCWEQGVLDTTFCVLLFNYYLIDKGHEDFSEEIGYRLYVFFAKNPYSILQLNYFINLMEKTYQKRLFEKILSDLFYETVVRNEQNEDETKLSEIDFFEYFHTFLVTIILFVFIILLKAIMRNRCVMIFICCGKVKPRQSYHLH